jgi:hypothetical protein
MDRVHQSYLLVLRHLVHLAHQGDLVGQLHRQHLDYLVDRHLRLDRMDLVDRKNPSNLEHLVDPANLEHLENQ